MPKAYNLLITTEDNTLFSSAAFFRVDGTFGIGSSDLAVTTSAQPTAISDTTVTTSAPGGNPSGSRSETPKSATLALTGVAAALLYRLKTRRKSAEAGHRLLL